MNPTYMRGASWDAPQSSGKDDGMLGGIIGAVAGLAGGLIGNRSSAKQAHYNREWQEHMSNTAHRRQVADMRAAGLNPILSATGGHGAASGSGGVASQQDPISPGVQSALAARRQSQELKNMRAQERSTSKEADIRAAVAKWAPRQELEKVYQLAYATSREAALASQAGDARQITANELKASDMDLKLRQANFPGDLDEARVHSSAGMAARRRSDRAAGGVKAWKDALLPWGGLGNSARSVGRPRPYVREPYLRRNYFQ